MNGQPVKCKSFFNAIIQFLKSLSIMISAEIIRLYIIFPYIFKKNFRLKILKSSISIFINAFECFQEKNVLKSTLKIAKLDTFDKGFYGCTASNGIDRICSQAVLLVNSMVPFRGYYWLKYFHIFGFSTLLCRF